MFDDFYSVDGVCGGGGRPQCGAGLQRDAPRSRQGLHGVLVQRRRRYSLVQVLLHSITSTYIKKLIENHFNYV